jgi:internalin A
MSPAPAPRGAKMPRQAMESGGTIVPAGVGEFIDPHADPVVQEYLAHVLDWHAYIRFLMFPQDDPDVRIIHLYVEPMLASRWLPPEVASPDDGQLIPALDVLAAHPRLVVLGDPGSGKSTLVNWIASQLAVKDAFSWAERFAEAYRPHCGGRGRLVPVPLVLRDLALRRQMTWDTLREAFLRHQMVREVAGFAARLDDLLRRGQAFVMLDGLDEIGNVEVRKALRAAVFEGMQRYPACRWLLTSRLVGYEAVPFHRETPGDAWSPPASFTAKRRRAREAFQDVLSGVAESMKAEAALTAREAGNPVPVWYVAPFRDHEIYQFCQKWFSHRDYNKGRAAQEASGFYERLRSDGATLRLARTPHLLTMMAMIFRARAHLPHGRALLYDEITLAYLEAIDRYRGLQAESDYPFEQKKRWLARVGFEMQRRRAERAAESEDETSAPGERREILAAAQEVEVWVAEAMRESGYDPRSGALAFLDFVKRRSGLLLPRGVGEDGQDQYAFLHLSLQEYFAACFLEEQLLSPRWARTGRGAPGANREDLRQYAQQAVWRETLVFLFELLASRPGWPEELAETLFGEVFTDVEAGQLAAEPAAVLLAQVAVDPHSGLPRHVRQQAIQVCCEWEAARQAQLREGADFFEYQPRVAAALFTVEREDLETVWQAFLTAVHDAQRLWLTNTGVTELEPLRRLTNLQGLWLANTGGTELEPLRGLTSLRELSLDNTGVTNLEPLGG